ncbi:hypothetical protein ACHAW5_008612 [Stephanodiscus triporus]|uniref:Methyltransferase domain-containing protein n=1 Tax=Stephanodiscus triporus TaxID=2934178 RepID=A0ABD3N9J2_9STRA
MDKSARTAARFGITQILLLANLILMSFLLSTFLKSAGAGIEEMVNAEAKSILPVESRTPLVAEEGFRRNTVGNSVAKTPTAPGIGSTDSAGFYFVHPREGERDFYKIGKAALPQTDKVQAPAYLPGCLENDASCTRPSCTRPECRPWGHHYDTIYQQRLGPFSRDDVEPFQFLEIGFFNGGGYDTGECHSIEISCIEHGPRNEGKWPWENFAERNPHYQQYLDENRLHCGDGADVMFLDSVWKNEMKRPDAPPLKIVVDDGAHLAEHMAQTVFFWFPRIEPRGLLIVEDIQPIAEANAFRTQFMPQIMKDLHFCGDPKQEPDSLCFPTLFPLLASIHCEMHICIFERNDHPAREPSLEESTLPKNALDMTQCKSMLPGHW